jgi:hypothetical protein
MVDSFFDTTLTQAEIDRFVARLFDKDPSTLRPASMHAPFSSENPPPVVRVFTFLDALYLDCLINMFCL